MYLCVFEVSLVYIVSCRAARTTEREYIRVLGAGIIDGCELSDMTLGANLSLLEEHYALLNTEPSLCPLFLILYVSLCLCMGSTRECRCPGRPEEGLGSPRVAVTSEPM